MITSGSGIFLSLNSTAKVTAEIATVGGQDRAAAQHDHGATDRASGRRRHAVDECLDRAVVRERRKYGVEITTNG